ncbi:MAG TPA: M20/M25/M40 family metallo-hydrolase, partial [Candidatus Sulfotelmatobacter sp.]|nr:M20/M25/M40 family metallo-hydrolase [Candidatus Sulfotelmatobacter sp.]
MSGDVLDPHSLLEEMVRIPSPTGEEEPLGLWLAERLSSAGFAAERDRVGNVIATWGEGERELLLLGHMDTAPGALEVHREGHRLHGRGAVDAKGPLAAAICAVARQPQDAGGRRLTVIGAVEEEGSSKGAWHLVNRRAPEELVVLEPSGWDAITVGYKGSMRLHYEIVQPAAHGAGPSPSAGDRAVGFIRRLQDHTAQVNVD